jgi:Uma2 family endonuclease
MSDVAGSFVTWTAFQQWPERSDGGDHYELHDGKVVAVPLPKPVHKRFQKRIEKLLEAVAGDRGVVQEERPYRPTRDLQFWYADVAYMPVTDWNLYRGDDYPVHAPLIVVEVLSPSNTAAKLNRQRMVAMSAGTKEFWIVDPVSRTVQVTDMNRARLYEPGERIETILGGSIAIDDIFC